MGLISLTNYSDAIGEICEKIQQMNISEIERGQTKTSVEFFYETTVDAYQNSQVEDRLGDILQLINSTPNYWLSWFQKQFIDLMIETVTPIIFQNVPANVMLNSLAKYGWLPPEFYMCHAETPRRIGKTVTMCAFNAALLAKVPGIRLLYFSLYERTCKQACKTVVDWLRRWGYFKSACKIDHTAMSVTFTNERGTEAQLVFMTGQNPDVSSILYIYIYFLRFFFPFFLSLLKTAVVV